RGTRRSRPPSASSERATSLRSRGPARYRLDSASTGLDIPARRPEGEPDAGVQRRGPRPPPPPRSRRAGLCAPRARRPARPGLRRDREPHARGDRPAREGRRSPHRVRVELQDVRAPLTANARFRRKLELVIGPYSEACTRLVDDPQLRELWPEYLVVQHQI